MEKAASAFERILNDVIGYLQPIGTVVCILIAIYLLIKSRSAAMEDNTMVSKKYSSGAIWTVVTAGLLWIVPAVVKSMITYFQ